MCLYACLVHISMLVIARMMMIMMMMFLLGSSLSVLFLFYWDRTELANLVPRLLLLMDGMEEEVMKWCAGLDLTAFHGRLAQLAPRVTASLLFC